MNYWYRVVSVIIIMMCLFTGNLISQPAAGENEYKLSAANPVSRGIDTLTSDAGRGIWVAHDPDLDNDGLPELIVTEYQLGGRVFVYELVGDDKLEFVWASPPVDSSRSGGGSTPRMVTTGDFDNDGNQEIIFPLGYFATDSAEAATRGIYFYEWTGNDNDYGTEPAYILRYEEIDSAFAAINTGRTENGLRVQDIDGDGRSELLFPPRSFDFSVAKLYILQVTSGSFEGGDAVIETEYVYEEMVLVSSLGTDGYVPVGTEIGDIDNDGLDEIIVAGWQNIGAGAGLGFIEITGEDTYTPGSIVRLADYSAFVVKAKPIFTTIADEPVIFAHGTNAGTSESQMWILNGIVADQFVTDANISPLFSNVGYWSAWAMGDQDHPTDGAGDGLNFYIYGGSGSILDIEYNGAGDVTDENNYTVKEVYNLADAYSNLGGLFNEFYTFPGMDLDNDGIRDFVAAYKGSTIDSLDGRSMAHDGLHVFFFEWGDSSQSLDLSHWITGIKGRVADIIMPDDYQLAQNYPNPFNPVTNIEFTLPISKRLSLKIYNVLGQEVRTLVDNQQYLNGTHTVQWDGKDDSGNPVASGVYIYKLIYGNFFKAKQMTLVR